MKKVATLIIIMIFVLNLFTGCDILIQRVDGLLMPPKLTEEQNNIDKALKNSVGNNINLVYPETGEYRSAYIMQDLDFEETDEAIIFYKERSDVSSSVRMNILDVENDKWVSTYDGTSMNATGVEKVSFIENEGTTFIVVGFNISGGNEKNLVIYRYDSRAQLETVFTSKCMDYEVYDINNDGELEIVLIANTVLLENQKETVAKMYRIENYNCKLLSSTYMDSSTTEYINISQGYAWAGQKALFFDGQKGTDSLATEILVANKDTIVNISYSEDVNLMQKRDMGIPCMDLNEDEIYDVPAVQLFPGYNAKDAVQSIYLTEWYNYVGDKMARMNTTYTDLDLGYYFIMPELWLEGEQVTAKKDFTNNEIVFYKFEEDLKNINNELLRIRVFIKSELNNGSLPLDYSVIATNGQLIYGYKIQQGNSGLSIDENTFRDNFALINN